MARYIVKRILLIPIIVLVIIFVLFALMYILPTSFVRQMPVYGGGDALDSIFTFFGAKNNMLTKYLRYCYNVIFHFDYGRTNTGTSLMDSLGPSINVTFIILASSIGAVLLVGIPAGVFTALRKNRPVDRIFNTLSLLFSSIPNYSLALLIALIFVLYLGILPMMNTAAPSMFIMPTLTIALGGISSIARMTRAAMLDVLDQPFITALRAKGLKETGVVYRHALKNAMIPILSALGGLIAQLICGTFVVEHFFNIRGIGFLMLRSVSARSHFEILGCTVIMTLIIVFISLIFDVLCACINPHIRYRYAKPNAAK